MKYGKLVRDRVPAIIEEEGRKAKTRQATESEYSRLLMNKLDEEVSELSHAKGDKLVEECADVLEVLDAILAVNGKTIEEAFAVKKEKKKERGGFEKRIVLVEVD